MFDPIPPFDPKNPAEYVKALALDAPFAVLHRVSPAYGWQVSQFGDALAAESYVTCIKRNGHTDGAVFIRNKDGSYLNSKVAAPKRRPAESTAARSRGAKGGKAQ